MTIERIACVASRSPLAQQGLALIEARESMFPVEDAEAIVALGGDGFMLDCFHRYLDTGLPIYGMNRGTVGFLMNGFHEDGLLEQVRGAEAQQLFPLRVTATDTGCETTSALAFNEVSLVRYSNQSANLQISIDGKVRMDKLMSDGVLVCTPAGSTAYNLSVHGPVIPIGAEIIGLTPISPFRPRRWRGASLPYTAHVEIINLDPEKRPLGASADSTEIKDVVSVSIRAWTQQSITVLFDHGHSLEERIIHEQFVE